MKLVLSNNRIIAHGENFISMGGGVVINTETGAKYERATVAECSNCPSDIGVVGYEYHAGEFVPCAPFGKGPGNVAVYCDDCKTPRDSGVPIDDVCQMSSYFAFVGNVNADMVAAAFGKNNENLIKNIGKQLAMYGWYKGEDKVNYPYTCLQKMLTINDINVDIYDEIIRSDNLSELIVTNEYAKSKFVESYSVSANVSYTQAGDTKEESKKIVVTAEDLLHPFRLSYTISGHYFSCEVAINGVRVNNKISEAESGNVVLGNWSEYNITSPGTYYIRASAHTSKGDADAKSELLVYKMKQSYDE